MEAMDFMDPKRRMHHQRMLAIGYALVAIALLLITTILLFVAYGFGLKNGQVIQNGLLFVSSSPNPAKIYVDGAKARNDTNTKLVLPEATYQFVLKRSGYRDWQHAITVNGGQVQSYVYPVLIPDSLTTNTVRSYAAAPALVTQSRDLRWLLVARPGLLTSFDLYDLNNPKQDPKVVAIPGNVWSVGAGTQTMDPVAWASDNVHLLLKHTYAGGAEYLLFDRENPDQSVNLTRNLALPAIGLDLTLLNNHFDRYLAYEVATHKLDKAVLGTPGLQAYVAGVLSYAATGDNFLLYATPDPVDAAKVDINLNDGNTTYTVRKDKAGGAYLLAMATYSGDMYLATCAVQDNVAFVYKNPLTALTNQLVGAAVPTQVLRIASPQSVSFSPAGQYVAFENKTAFAIYDAETDRGYRYQESDTLDAPQNHAQWVDNAHLTYVSYGQVVVIDFDGENRQTLVSADPRYQLMFAQSNKYLYSLVTAADDKNHELLTSTALRIASDL